MVLRVAEELPPGWQEAFDDAQGLAYPHATVRWMVLPCGGVHHPDEFWKKVARFDAVFDLTF